ncbi:hypothetical protein [Terribacillus sp. JSM ZJ617]|uniref:hypothetical protein n=1 Tax=Terribacillus sp. JSM ZJ617 TaxID=3342119 RepID=UPI0035A81A64
MTEIMTDADKWVAETTRRLQLIKYLKAAGIKQTPVGKALHKASLVDLERLNISVQCANS